MAQVVEPIKRIGLEGVIVKETTMSLVNGLEGKLYYQGYRIEDLAEHSTYEDTVFLLWNGRLPTRQELEAFQKELAEARALPEGVMALLRGFPKEVHPMAALRTAVSALGLFDPEAEDDSREANVRKATRLVARFPTIVAAYQRLREGKDPVPPRTDLGHAANFLYMLSGKEPDEFTARVMDVALILHADHGINASTFSAMVTASTLSDIYSAITSAVGTLKGPLHGGANERVMRMLLEIGSEENVVPWLEKAFAEKRRIMGCGHRVYKVKDPRAKILERFSQRLAEITGNETWYRMSKKVEDEVVARLGHKGIYPNVDFYSASVYYYMGIPFDLYTPIFAVSRVAGWTGHVLEQYAKNRLIRPRAEYVGEIDKPYVPLDQRG